MDERLDVWNVVAALGLYADDLRWNDLVDLFTHDVTTDYSAIFGGDPQRLTREDLVSSWMDLLPGFTRTQHLIGLAHVTISEGFAYAEAPVIAHHVMKDAELSGSDTWVVGGYYEMQIEKNEGEWRIRSLTLASAWQEGNRDLVDIAIRRVQEGKGRRRLL